VALARLVLEAALYPNPLPDEPLPAPLHLALGYVASRIWRWSVAIETESGTPGLPVVREEIGAYSYSTASPPSTEHTLLLDDAVTALIAPWLPAGRQHAYELDLASASALDWPANWWQRNLPPPPP